MNSSFGEGLMRKTLTITLVALFFACLIVGSAYADLTGQIQGTVLDSSNAAIPDAKITIKRLDTGTTRVVSSNEYGEFAAPQLEIGEYEVGIEKVGFKTHVEQALVRSGEITRMNVQMQVGQVGTTVTVEASALPTLDVATAQVSDSLNSEEVLALPNEARDPVVYATLSPGTVPVTADNPFLGAGGFNSNGSRGRANNITLDGVNDNDVSTTGEAGAAFVQDNIQEVKVITNNFDAEFGRNSGSQVQLLTKSGTNSYHGSVYDYAQNTYFGNARNYFDATGQATPIIQDNGGVTFGGPIYKDHTFFYGSWELDRTSGAGGSVVAQVLTPAQVAGITDPTSLALFNNNGAPQSATGSLPQTSANTFQGDTWTVRVDQLLRNKKDSLFVKYGQSPGTTVSPGLTFVSTFLAGFGASVTAEPRDLTVGYTASITSNLVDTARFGFGRSNPNFPINSPFPQSAQVVIFGESSFGESDIIPQGRTQNTFQYADTLAWTKGRHTLKVGIDFNRYQAPSFFPAEEKGLIEYGSVADFQAGNAFAFQQVIGPTARHNFSLDAFMFAQDDFRVTNTLTLNLGFRLESSGGVSELNNLISNLDPNNHTPLGVLGTGPLGGVDLGGDAFHRNWNPAPRLGIAWNPGRGKFVFRGGYGIAYDFIYQNPITNLRFSPPFVDQITIFNFSGGNTPAALIAGTAPAQVAAAASLGAFNPAQTDFGGFAPVDQNLKNPRNQQWNAGVEYAGFSNLVLKLSYVGAHSDRLQVSQPINHVLPADIPAPPTSLADQTARQDEFLTTFTNETGPAFGPGINDRLDPRFDSVTQIQSTGTSTYNSLQLEALRRFRNGLTFNANYTWAHCLDDVSDALGVLINDSAALLDPTKPLSFQRSNCEFDVRNRFVVSYDYEIPYAKRFTGWKRTLLDGWGTSGIASLQSGFPVTFPAPPVNFAPDAAFPFGGSVTDLLLDGDSNVSLNGNATQLIPVPQGHPQKVDPTTIVSEPLLEQEGTSGRNQLRLAGIHDWDMAVSKRFRITESKSFQLRWEAFNVLNHSNFGGYGNNLANFSANPANNFFNVYTATSTVNRQFQITGKFLF
jgi:Carboxypeptidase regulatory-like domain